MQMSDSIKELACALVKVQAELVPVSKDKNNYFNQSYVGLDTVMPLALAILSKHGIALTQTPGTSADGVGTTLTTALLHVSGEWLTDTQPLLLEKPTAQGQGSAITYARRYGLMSVLGIVAEEDDDGQQASKKATPRRKAQNGKAETQAEAKPTRVMGDLAAKATAQQTATIIKLLKESCGDDEREQIELAQSINKHAVNELGTQMALSTITQAEAGDLIRGIQQKAKEAAPAN